MLCSVLWVTQDLLDSVGFGGLALQASVCNLGFLGRFLKTLKDPSGFRIYLDPKELTFLGFLIMISLYKSLKW